MAPRAWTTAISAAAALLLALPASAGAALPTPGDWNNPDPHNGARFTATRQTLRDVSIFCKDTSFDLKTPFVHVGRDGRFSYRGVARRWGPAHQWWGDYRVTVT